MALECVCFPVAELQQVMRGAGARAGQRGAEQNRCQDKPPRPQVDLCEVVKRTRDHEQTKHSEYECHLQGERRQNLINKIKMFLDDYDDRPVMKRAGQKDAHSAKGQSGYGPLIKYPGYVDYDHPYFSDPYDKMPALAMTVGQRAGDNPCPPLARRNYYEGGHGQQQAETGGFGEGRSAGDQQAEQGGGCHCARKRAEAPLCPAASRPRQRRDAQQWSRDEMFPQGAPLSSPPTPASPTLLCVCRHVS